MAENGGRLAAVSSKYPGSKAEADDRFIALCAKTDPEHEFSIDTCTAAGNLSSKTTWTA